MADLIVSVVVDVLRHVAIQNRKGARVERVSTIDSRDFVVLGPSQFGVLNPQIGLDLLESIQKLQNRDVTLREIAIAIPLLAKRG